MRSKIGWFLTFLLLTLTIAWAGKEIVDWRNSASLDQKIDNLIKVMPGSGNIMIEIGERYKNLYWSGRQDKWEFAAYQAEEIEELLEVLMVTRPKHAKAAKTFLAHVFPKLSRAIHSRDWRRFSESFEYMRGQCNSCHVRTGHSFVELPIPRRASSPVLNMD